MDITHAHNILGAAHLRDGNYEKTNEHFEKCLQREEALKHLPGMATSFYNPGLVACQRGTYSKALEGISQKLWTCGVGWEMLWELVHQLTAWAVFITV